MFDIDFSASNASTYTCLAIAQTKPASSRAIAVVTTVGDFPARASSAQPFLRLPCGITDRLDQALLPQQLLSADARREPITPGSLDQHSARRAIPSFRDAALAARGAAGVLGRNQAKLGHELAGIVEAGDVAKFCNQCRRRDQSHSA